MLHIFDQDGKTVVEIWKCVTVYLITIERKKKKLKNLTIICGLYIEHIELSRKPKIVH